MASTRTETDSFGPIAVPADRLWGAQTQRSTHYFAIGEERMPLAVIRALALVKKAAARLHARRSLLPQQLAAAIEAAADEVIAGRLDEHFPLSVWQTGSGTQTNMNVNEVIANHASGQLGAPPGSKTLVHPNDHVNQSQSSNDVFSTAMNIAAAGALRHELLPQLSRMRATLDAHARAWQEIVKVGRTHLMDATPLTLGQEMSGYAAQVGQSHDSLAACLPDLEELAIGGTAVGTGLNAPAGFAADMVRELADLTGQPFTEAASKFAAIAAHDALVDTHGTLVRLAAALGKIANDIRWMGSGPRCGLGELRLPENEPGSSIMAGKVNPTQAEALLMVCARVLGNATTVAIAGASGNFELNVHKPVLIYTFLQSTRLLTDAARSFTDHCLAGLQPDEQRIRELLERSLMLATALVPVIGYDATARVVATARGQNISLREAVLQLGLLQADAFDRVVQPARMLGPH
jgi:fumarate hydratase class II